MNAEIIVGVSLLIGCLIGAFGQYLLDYKRIKTLAYLLKVSEEIVGCKSAIIEGLAAIAKQAIEETRKNND